MSCEKALSTIRDYASGINHYFVNLVQNLWSVQRLKYNHSVCIHWQNTDPNTTTNLLSAPIKRQASMLFRHLWSCCLCCNWTTQSLKSKSPEKKKEEKPSTHNTLCIGMVIDTGCWHKLPFWHRHLHPNVTKFAQGFGFSYQRKQLVYKLSTLSTRFLNNDSHIHI